MQLERGFFQVLEKKKGIPVTLSIVYHEVAKRLGLDCQPVNFPQHFLLKWRPRPTPAQGRRSGKMLYQ